MEPATIKKLDETVINRIAAGEIIQRPSNALKELIENSIDAKSTNILITVKSGGLKYLHIQDNGTGIRKEDLPIVCERFTTSKLETFEDLSHINTYGFRGEALASISHIAHLTIVTKTVNEKCAYQATYVDGKLTDKPKPCAGNQGTQIIVEDLFYNMSTRRNALKNATEEYLRIYDVVCKYAIHNCSTGFALKKFGERNDLKTPVNSSHINNIRIVYGNEIAKELLELEFYDENLKFYCHGFITNVNYSTKRSIFLLFINHRLVESSNLRKTIDSVYSAYLPKGASPFLYISLEIDPKNCDVNVHPTKNEVHFLNEEHIVEKIRTEVENKLLGSNTSRTLYVQTRLPGATDVKTVVEDAPKTYDKNLVRTDAKEQKLETFFGETSTKKSSSDSKSTRKFEFKQNEKKHQIPVRLASVLQLRKTIIDNCNTDLRDLIAQHKFVGNINPKQTLIQHGTKLFLCNTKKLSEELFYQFLIFDFQNFDQITFKTPLSIHDLILVALEYGDILYNRDEDGPKEEIAQSVQKILTNKSEMLKAYFVLEIENGYLVSIPLLLPNYLPDMSQLPVYVLKLATEVEWDTEKECFDTFARQTAIFYSNIATDQTDFAGVDEQNAREWSWVVEHVLYPALKRYFIPDSSFSQNGALIQVANLPDLYKVFERC